VTRRVRDACRDRRLCLVGPVGEEAEDEEPDEGTRPLACTQPLDKIIPRLAARGDVDVDIEPPSERTYPVPVRTIIVGWVSRPP
jgi:hypothetical protein